ncbi:MAG: family 16 glycosylhydrolase [Phycisphaerales bacterium]
MFEQFLIRAATVAISGVLAAPAAAQSWDLVWEDNFDGFELDTTKWEYMYGTGSDYGLEGWGNNELQYYTDSPNNVRVVGGILQITARRENFMSSQYTSGRIRSLNKGDFQYGRIEMRAIIPDAQGVWPAFWMLPTNSPYGGWPMSGEIDIMESTNDADRIHGTIHFGNSWPNNSSTGGSTTLGGTDFSAGYHVYAIEWESDEMRWYIDDVMFSRKTSNEWFSGSSAAAGNPLAPFDNPFHLLLNVAVGGNWPGSPNPSDYPVTMTVDYVRVYQQVQSPYTADELPHPVPGLIEVEDFDDGLPGQAYADSDSVNEGGQYRDTGVDIEVCSEGGFNVAYMNEGEWLEYTIDVAETGTYRVDVRNASQITGGEFRFEIDGQPVSQTIYAFPTGGWQTWQTTPVEVELEAGEHVIRWANRSTSGREYNLNWFDFVLLTAPCFADIDGSGSLNVDDIDAFVTAFLASDSAADCDGNGTLNIDDVDCFVAAFLAGCD